MRYAAFSGLVILVTVVVAWTVPSSHHKIHWAWASHEDRIESYRSYLDTWPVGEHTDEAESRIDQLLLQAVGSASSISDLEHYLDVRPDGAHKSRAVAAIDSLRWREAVSVNTIVAVEQYLDQQAQGEYRSDAQAKMASLRSDESIFTLAREVGTEESLRTFLSDYPGHVMEARAQTLLRDLSDGRDIVDLLSEGKIEVEIQGNGITNVRLGIRRLTPYPIKVRVPAGSFFASARASAQNMVSTAGTEVVLASHDWERISVPAACANRPKDIPEGNDTFTVRRSSNQTELLKLASVLDAAHLDTETRQAAVWIVTDNADYDDLGILIASRNGYSGSRVINEPEAAEAMRTCVEAGIDITRKAIWNDRGRILRGLNEGALKSWLSQKM